MKEHIARIKSNMIGTAWRELLLHPDTADLVGTLCPPTSLVVLPNLSELSAYFLAMALILLWFRYGLFIRFEAKYVNKKCPFHKCYSLNRIKV
jgi:hypothetical protein